MTNVALARKVLQYCRQMGVREVVLCAGARNAPFVALLSRPDQPFQVTPYFEERSGAFYALGRIQAQGQPLAVITTSGTAAAELLPAAIEADYQGLPLLLITADRPRHYRGTGAPQTIRQPGLFSHYVERTEDAEGEWIFAHAWSRRRPLHLNVCFDEPLLDEPVPEWTEPTAFALPAEPERPVPRRAEMKKPLILVGGLRPGSVAVEVLQRWRRPIYAEGPSQLRGAFGDYEVLGGEKSLAQLDYDGVIRVGSVPTLRLWRDLERRPLPVMHFSQLPFPGLPRASEIFDLADLALLKTDFVPWRDEEHTVDRACAQKLGQALGEFPLSEPAWMQWLSRQLPGQARLFVGNSLPIREWDLAAERRTDLRIFANRGVNGIDGLVSSFMGLCEPQASNWCVIGDLSALYDLSGLWPARHGQFRDVNLVIINNGGGGIFRPLFGNELFENRHTLQFAHWAAMWNWDYLRLETPRELPPTERPRIIEITPDNAQTDRFNALWSRA